MKFEINSWLTGKILFSFETETIKLAVEAAVKQRAYLRDAYLRDVNLQDADLQRAYLQGANLQGAKNLNKYAVTPLLILLDQPGKIRVYKLVKENGEGPFNGEVVYKKGKTISVKDIDKDEFVQCGKGINVATLDWCIKEWKEGYRILIVEFTAKDIACIPVATDGKFRLIKCRVIGEKDLREIGLIKEESHVQSQS